MPQERHWSAEHLVEGRELGSSVTPKLISYTADQEASVVTDQPVRNCPKCGKEINAEATRCMHCFAKSDPLPKRVIDRNAPQKSLPDRRMDGGPSFDAVRAPQRSSGSSSSHATSVIHRYRDAYAIAVAIVQQGQRVKTLAVVIAVVVVVLSMFAATKFAGMVAIVFGIVAAIFVYGVVHSYGVRIAAEGQHLLASLDVAVNTSPFLDDDERAYAMSLV